jgi:hypothetical protein
VDGEILTRVWGPGFGMKTLQRHLLKIEKHLEKDWWRWTESNRRRRGYEPRALTI